METVIAPLDTIRCPNCRHVIPISEMLSHQIAERARAQSKAEIEELRTALAREQREIKEREKKVEVLVEKRVAARVAKIEQDEREKARGSVSLEIKDLKNQLAEVLKQRDAAQKGELEARKRARELDQRAKNLDLEAARKIDAERQKIQNEASKRAEEQYQLKLAEKEKQIRDAKKANDELKRKLEQGSQQAQGEVPLTSRRRRGGKADVAAMKVIHLNKLTPLAVSAMPARNTRKYPKPAAIAGTASIMRDDRTITAIFIGCLRREQGHAIL